MEINIYFEPLEPESLNITDEETAKRIGDIVDAYTEKAGFPDLEDTDIAILGVKEDRNAFDNNGCSNSPDYIRKHLYNLFKGSYNLKLADLGNINQGYSADDTYFALSSVVEELIRNGIFPIILGGSQDLTYAQYKGYNNLGKIINLLSVDSLFDIEQQEEGISSRSYLSNIILHQPNYLFNFTNLGYQTYLIDPEAIKLIDQLYFDAYRLGKVRSDMEETEPIIRNCDLLSFDVSAIRFSDAPGNNNASPNGFNGEEACRIMRYAGLSDKLSSLGIYEYNPSLDTNEISAKLIAQMIWHFFDGFYNRMKDYPEKNMKDFLKFLVKVEEQDDEVVFYKSKKSERWWMEIPVDLNLKAKYQSQHIIPCSHRDYQIACEDVIPDRWWQFYQKLV